MEKHSYFREQLNVLTQFTAAFDDCFVYRYSKDFIAKEKIHVRYVMGPKNRVLYDIVNQAKNLTLPVISMDQKNIKRDSSRIQFKGGKITSYNSFNQDVKKIPSPVPVTMDVDVSIVANYKEDIDQIVSNFIAWCNPYFIITWKVPEEFGMDHVEELRTEVTWSGSVDYETPINIDNTEKYRIVGNTSFNLKGWIFPVVESPTAPIYVVRTNFVAVSSSDALHYDNYPSLSQLESTETILISAYPEFTNCFINGLPFDSLELNDISYQTFTFFGKRYGFNNSWYLSSNNVISVSGLDFEEIRTARYPVISAYKIPDNLITTVNDNIVTIRFGSGYSNLSSGDYTFVTSNSAGWAKSCNYSIPEEPIIIIESSDMIYNGILLTYNGESMIYSTNQIPSSNLVFNGIPMNYNGENMIYSE